MVWIICSNYIIDNGNDIWRSVSPENSSDDFSGLSCAPNIELWDLQRYEETDSSQFICQMEQRDIWNAENTRNIQTCSGYHIDIENMISPIIYF